MRGFKGATHKKVYGAIKAGILTRPTQCSRCLKTPGPAKDGRTQIHGHHHDYSKPLEVEWLCAKCHKQESPLPEKIGAPTFGSRNGWSKLNEEQAAEIRSSSASIRTLAKQYGIHHSTVCRIKNHIYWPAAAPAPEPKP